MVLYSLEELYDGAIIVCPECKGRGEINWLTNICGNYEQLKRSCSICKGKGTVHIKLEVIEYNEALDNK